MLSIATDALGKDSPLTQLRAWATTGVDLRGVARSEHTAYDETTPVEVEQAVHQVNTALALREVGLQFSVDKDTDKLIVKVIDRASGEVIRQIPNEEVVRIAKLVSDGKGLLVDHAA